MLCASVCVCRHCATIATTQTLLARTREALEQIKEKDLQFDLQGVRNVWIVKPGAKSRGRGTVQFTVLHHLSSDYTVE